MLNGRCILIISPESWGDNFLSKHHYALELAKRDNQVFFLGTKVEGEKLFIDGNIRELYSPKTIPAIRFLPSFIRRKIDLRTIDAVNRQIGSRPDIIWSFDNSRFYNLLSWGKDTLRIAHIMDYRMDYNLREHAHSASICFGVTSAIVNKLKRANPNSHFIQHGVQFSDVTKVEREVKNPLAVYVGNLNIPFIDWPLIFRTVDEFPEVCFEFIGSFGIDNLNDQISNGDQISRLAKRKNVVLRGVLEREALTARLHGADVLLVFYDHKNFFYEVSNSHKILTYLSTGKTIVSTWIEEYKDAGLLEMSYDDEEFLAKMKDVAGRLDYYNAKERCAKRMMYAKDNTYAEQVNRIESLLKVVKK